MEKNLVKNNAVATTILDAEIGDFVPVTYETQKMAAYIHQQAILGVFISAVAIKKMFDDKLYLGLGCQSKSEYCAMLPYGVRQAEKLYRIASKFEDVSKNLIGNGLPAIGSSDTLENANSSSHLPSEELSALGVTKLYELTKLEDENIKDLIKEGKTEVNGQELVLEEIKEASAKEVARIVGESTKKYKSKISQMTEENALLAEEKKATEKELNALKEKNDKLRDIEMKYGPVASLLEHKREKLDEARRLLNDFVETMVRTGVTEDDPATMRKDLQDLIRKVDDVHNVLMVDFEAVIIE